MKSEDGDGNDEKKDSEQLVEEFVQFVQEFARFIKDYGIVIMVSIAIVAIMFVATLFIFFYGSPWMVIWSVMLIMLKFRVCDYGVDITLEKFINKHLKISITIG